MRVLGVRPPSGMRYISGFCRKEWVEIDGKIRYLEKILIELSTQDTLADCKDTKYCKLALV